MCLLVQPNRSKLWRVKYRHGGRERVYSIGVYSEIGLSAARVERDSARAVLRDAKDPTVERRISNA